MLKSLSLIITFSILSILVKANDILILKNNFIFEGKVIKFKKSNLVFESNNQEFSIPEVDIKQIIFEKPNDKNLKHYLKIASADGEICELAKFDADYYHKKEVGHFVLGMLFGAIAVIGTIASNPTPEKGVQTMYRSKNKEYFDNPEYLKCYKKKVKGKLIGAELFGIGALLLLVAVSN